MTYDAAVIADDPGNYWRLNEGAGATAALDYGNAPGMLWPARETNAGVAIVGPSGAGFSGITASGGSVNVAASGLWSRVGAAVGSSNVYAQFYDPGCLEFWYFLESVRDFLWVGWIAPSAPVGQQGWGVTCGDNLLQAQFFSTAITNMNVIGLGRWHHVALSWQLGSAFVYIDGQVSSPIGYTAGLAGTHVHFLVGEASLTPNGLNVAGLVTEVASFRRALGTPALDAHAVQAELAGRRPHWLGNRGDAATGSVTIDHAYTLGVTHVARTGSGSFSVPTGLRGFKIDIIPPFPGGRVSLGTPPYLWDVGWVSLLNADGMLAEIRPNRDTRVWLARGAELATTFTHDLLPGWTIDVTELDPA